jgi:hypothetical protein
MNATTSGQTISAPPQAPEPETPYETCEQCGEPVESSQRYCVVCGTRRKHAYDPAAQFLSRATSRSRPAGRVPRTATAGQRRTFSLGAALVVAVIPLAVGLGVLIGHSSGGSDAKLLSALSAQKATVVTVEGGGGGGAASTTATGGTAGGAGATSSTGASSVPTAATKLSSDFSLQRGYTVQLQTLPAAGTTQATVTAAERSGRAKGATSVGLITPADFHLTPSPPAGDYVIFSGQYTTKSAADAALRKLGAKFAGAKVVVVQSSSAPAASTKVVSRGAYGAAHQVTGYKPTASQLATGAAVVKKVSKQIDGNYVNSQKGLPDAVSVPWGRGCATDPHPRLRALIQSPPPTPSCSPSEID